MKEIKGSVWQWYTGKHEEQSFVVVVPINLTLRSNGSLVMGAGVALQAANRIKYLPQRLGKMVSVLDPAEMIANILLEDILVCALPTKFNWSQPSDLPLIERSAKALKILAEDYPHYIFLLPPPGCGLGMLRYRVVRPLLVDLPDNVWVVSLQGYTGRMSRK